MNKDALLATIIGFIIGLFIMGAILLGPKIVHMLPKINFKLPTISLSLLNKPKTTPTGTPAPKEFSVTIDSPLPESIESKNEVLVSGNTGAGSIVVIEGNTTDVTMQVKDDGKYAGNVTLDEGENEITVTSYNKDKKAVQTITVYYTPEEF